MPKWLMKLLIRLGRLEQFVADVLYDRIQGPRTWPLTFLLRALAIVFGGVVRTRTWLYKKRLLRSQPLGCLVVVVGNLTVGGTGKTPVVEKFCRVLTQHGRRVAILTRGYKSRTEPLRKQFFRWLTHTPAPPPKVVSDGKTVLLDPLTAGDEPYMLAHNLPGVVVLADKDRVRAGYYAIKHFGVDTLVLDDGFQYLPLKGRLNVLLIDSTNPFGNHFLLPRGILREPISHLRRASCVFFTKSKGGTSTQALRKMVMRYKPNAEIVECQHRPQYLQEVNGPKILPLSSLKGTRIAALSGIAMPEGFEAFLRTQGAELIYIRRFLDHHWFTEEELDHFFSRALSGKAILAITTEKDAVRIAPTYPPKVPFYYLRLEVETIDNPDSMEAVITRICSDRNLL